MIRAPWVCALLALSGPLSAQQKISEGRAVPADAQIRVWSPSGSIRLVGWDQDSIAISGTAERRAGRLFLVTRGRGAKIGFEGDPGDEGSAKLEIRVPRGSTLWVKSSSADVEVTGMTGSLDLYSVTGGIRVVGELQQLAAETMGGDMDLTVLAPTIRAKTGSGSITLRGHGPDVSLSSVDGSLYVSGARFRQAHFQTIAGQIRFHGGLERGGALHFQSHDGPIEIHLPPNTGANFLVSTYDGTVESKFPLFRMRGRDLKGKEIEFANAGGGASVIVRTYKGQVSLHAPASSVRTRKKPQPGEIVTPRKVAPPTNQP